MNIPGSKQYFFPASQIFEGIYLMINTIASFWRENTLVYLSLDIIYSSKLAVFHQLRSRKTVETVETDNVHAQISVCIFALNGDYCLFYSLLLI